MTPLLNEILGLSSAAPEAEVGRASEMCFQFALARASRGDADAQRELLALRIAYLNWAYVNPQFPVGAANLNAISAVNGVRGASALSATP